MRGEAGHNNKRRKWIGLYSSLFTDQVWLSMWEDIRSPLKRVFGAVRTIGMVMLIVVYVEFVTSKVRRIWRNVKCY